MNYPMSLRMLLRDWRSGELRVLAAALIVAVAGVTAVGFFTDRIRLALEHQATEMLGADLVISASRPLGAPILEAPLAADLRRARTVEFPSMAISAEGSQLAAIRAVSDDYPLRGDLRISLEQFAPDRVADGVPEPGAAWLESRLMSALGVDVGDQIALGDAGFRVAAVLTGEPVSDGGLLFNVAPRLMVNLRDLERTGLIQPGSRARYRYLFAGERASINEFRDFSEQRLRPGERLESIEEAQPRIREALDRGRDFLSLAALVSVLLAGVAVAMSTRRFMARHLDNCAVMRCIGVRQATLLRLYLLQMLWLGIGAAAIGSLIGYFAQYGLERALGGLVQMSLPAPSGRPLALGLATALITLLGFALPPLLHLRNVPALRVMRRELGGVSGFGLMAYLGGAAAMAALVFWHAGGRALGVYILLGALGTLAVLALVAGGLILVLRMLRPRLLGAWRFGLLGLAQRSGSTVVQVMAFGLGITILLLLGVVRGDLLAEWERGLPPDAPNRFLINIQPDQVDDLQGFFAEHDREIPTLYPMVRGRLVAIGDERVIPESYADERAQRLARREFNLSWADRIQEGNRIVAGRWWSEQSQGEPVVSVEEGLAETLGIVLGGMLTFDIAGTEIDLAVTSLREVEWDSFRANFFVLAPPGVFDDFPVSYISSLHVPPGEHGILNEMVRAFPNITVIDIAAIMEQVRNIMDQVALAVEYVFIFTLLAGLLVMFAAIHSTLDERIRETVLLRTLGASRRQLMRGLVAEFTSLGVLSGLVAAFAATLIGYLLASQVFHLGYVPDPALWLIGAVVGAVGVGMAGVLGTRFVLDVPPVKALRESM